MVSASLLPFAIAVFASAIATFAVRSVARHRGVVSSPRADRWHPKPTPLLGGVALWLATLGTTLFILPIAAWPRLLPIAAAATGMCALGLLDDFISIKPTTKLTGQIAVGCMIIASGWSVGAVRGDLTPAELPGLGKVDVDSKRLAIALAPQELATAHFQTGNDVRAGRVVRRAREVGLDPGNGEDGFVDCEWAAVDRRAGRGTALAEDDQGRRQIVERCPIGAGQNKANQGVSEVSRAIEWGSNSSLSSDQD